MPNKNRKRSRDRDEYRGVPEDQIPYDDDRAVVGEDLFWAVIRARRHRAQRSLAEGRPPDGIFPLQGTLVCSHCIELVQAGTPHIEAKHARMTGQTDKRGRQVPIYRYVHHRPGKPSNVPSCGVRVKSLHTHLPENDVLAILEAMKPLEGQQNVMIEIAKDLYEQSRPSKSMKDDVNPQMRIKMLEKRIVELEKWGRDPKVKTYTYDDYVKDRADIEDEIERLKLLKTGPEEIIVTLNQCINLICDFTRLWELADEKEQKRLINLVFAKHGIHYDLETERITYIELVPAMRYFLHIRSIVDGQE